MLVKNCVAANKRFGNVSFPKTLLARVSLNTAWLLSCSVCSPPPLCVATYLTRKSEHSIAKTIFFCCFLVHSKWLHVLLFCNSSWPNFVWIRFFPCDIVPELSSFESHFCMFKSCLMNILRLLHSSAKLGASIIPQKSFSFVIMNYVEISSLSQYLGYVCVAMTCLRFIRWTCQIVESFFWGL